MTLEQRFWAKVERLGPDECWPWTAGKTTGGYGAIRDAAGRVVYAHRVSASLAGLDLTDETLHTCDRPDCVNPAHLIPADHTANMRDMFAKGRRRVKLSHAGVAEIRERYRDGETQTSLAAAYQVSQGLISQVVRGEAWA